MRLGELLISKQWITPTALEKGLQLQQQVGGRLGGLLMRLGELREEQLLEALAEQWQLPLLHRDLQPPDDLQLYESMKAQPWPLEWFLRRRLLIWQQDHHCYALGLDPLNTELGQLLAFTFAQHTLLPVLAPAHDLERLLDFIQREQAVNQLFSGQNKALAELAEEAPVVELVNNILAQAVQTNASDIHFEPGEDAMIVRFRVDGVLHHHLTQPASRFAALSSRIKLISGMDIAENRLPQDGRITSRIAGKEMDLRVSSVPCNWGESLVLRLLPKERDQLSLNTLGMIKKDLATFRRGLGASNGIVLVTGPTGSGKSTSLYAALQEKSSGSSGKIITVEDPIEYQMPSITQIQANSEIGYTFARALRAILRQDPDTIMIGEIRDLETAEIAIQSAMTGHLVLSTLHTNDALSSFTRLIDMGVEPFLVAAPMRAVQAQRLVRRLCQHCAQPADYPEAVWRADLPHLKERPRFHRAQGCPACQHTGYKGRMGIYEIIEVDEALRHLIATGAERKQMQELIEQQGYTSLLQDGLYKAAQGLTSIEEVLRVVGQTREVEDHA